jgi:MFS family permease
MNWRFVVRALRHRNYRLFYGGQGISLVGTWMTRVAIGWPINRLTHSAFLLGLVSFSGQIPILVLGPMAGVWVDRWDRHRVLVVTQVLSMLSASQLPRLRQLVHPIYVRIGIVPELATGIHAASVHQEPPED